MVLRYSPDRNLLYVELRDGEVAETAELDEEIYVDLDPDGRPVGIEFLDAGAFLPFLQRLLPESDGVMMEIPATLRDLLDRRFGVAVEDDAVAGLVRQPGSTAVASGA
ncbi:MAG: DUF2283 domain-containing protein [Chloroflexia bacterium]|nr:DUF2283 domain-containing protein [Chloroflexia bacterium]